MCRRASSVPGARFGIAALVAGLLAAAANPAGAQTETFPLEPETRQQLSTVQTLWIDWLAQLHQGEMEKARETVDELSRLAKTLGVRSFPELATAASVQAATFSAAAEFDKAEAALWAAEILQPGSPEAALARLRIERDQGHWISAGLWVARAGGRLVAFPVTRRVLLANVYQWLLVVLTLSAFSFVGLQMAARGGFLIADLREFMERSLPAPAALFLATALVIWPIVLPAGLLWIALYWSVLLWGYGSKGVRVVMVVLWLFVGSLPLLVSEHIRRLEFSLSKPLLTVENIASGRMTGAAFVDLGVLAELLPESSAVKHFQADLHLQLRQWEEARNLYREVLDSDGQRADVLADLGTVYFYDGDLDNAVRYLQQAAESSDVPAAVYFNLSLVLSEQYRFTESEAMLRRANTIDSVAVGEWIAGLEANRVVRASGGFARLEEIREELALAWRGGGAQTSLLDAWRKTLSLPLALVLAGPAVGVFLLARRSGRRRNESPEPWFGGLTERLRHAVLPGLTEAEANRLGGTWLALAFAVSLAALPFSGDYGFSLLLGYAPGITLSWAVAAIGLIVLVVVRFMSVDTGGSRGS